jgi:hypothetical protein
VSDIALKTVSLIALVLTFAISTSMLVLMTDESRRIPKFLLEFLQRAAPGQPLVGRRDWSALLIFGFTAAAVLFAEARTLDFRFRQDGSLDIESIAELVLQAGWIGYLFYNRPPGPP